MNSEFSFSYTSCLTKAEELSLPRYLPIAGGRIIGFIPFPRVLVLCEMQSVSSRIWTRVALSISYDDNHYTTGTSKYTTGTSHCILLINPDKNIIKDNERTSIIETKHTSLWKYISLVLFSKGAHSLLQVWKIDGETYTQRGDFFLAHIFFLEPGGANVCTPLQAVSWETT